MIFKLISKLAIMILATNILIINWSSGVLVAQAPQE